MIDSQETQILDMVERQRDFLHQGGVYRRAISLMREKGQIERNYVFQEFPKMLHFADGAPVVVEDAAEEAKIRGLRGPDPKLDDNDSTEALELRLADLKRKAELRRQIADMAAQEAAEAVSEHVSDADMKTDLRALGVNPDPKWDAARLKKELERASAKV